MVFWLTARGWSVIRENHPIPLFRISGDGFFIEFFMWPNRRHRGNHSDTAGGRIGGWSVLIQWGPNHGYYRSTEKMMEFLKIPRRHSEAPRVSTCFDWMTHRVLNLIYFHLIFGFGPASFAGLTFRFWGKFKPSFHVHYANAAEYQQLPWRI